MKFLFLSFVFVIPLFAYLDPGSGSLLLSSIVALFASIVFFIKNIFYKLLSFSPSALRYRGGGVVALLKVRIL